MPSRRLFTLSRISWGVVLATLVAFSLGSNPGTASTPSSGCPLTSSC